MSAADCSSCHRIECDRQAWPCGCWCHREYYQRETPLERLRWEREQVTPR